MQRVVRLLECRAEGAELVSQRGACVLSKRLKDVELIRTGRINSSTWHFFSSPVSGSIGPSAPLGELLQKNGIGVVIH